MDLSDFISHLYAIILPLALMPGLDVPSDSPGGFTQTIASMSVLPVLVVGRIPIPAPNVTYKSCIQKVSLVCTFDVAPVTFCGSNTRYA